MRGKWSGEVTRQMGEKRRVKLKQGVVVKRYPDEAIREEEEEGSWKDPPPMVVVGRENQA